MSGSVYSAMFAQVPLPKMCLAPLHDLHVPGQAVLQQKPSTQKPLVHCDAIVQEEPFGKLDPVQVPPEQVKPAAQSALTAQVVLQDVVPQT